MSDELEDLTNLTKHPGWLRLTNHVREEWAVKLSRHVEVCANEVNDAIALQKLRQVIAAKKAVDGFMAWPEERLKTLANHPNMPAAFSLYRGGV